MKKIARFLTLIVVSLSFAGCVTDRGVYIPIDTILGAGVGGAVAGGRGAAIGAGAGALMDMINVDTINRRSRMQSYPTQTYPTQSYPDYSPPPNQPYFREFQPYNGPPPCRWYTYYDGWGQPHSGMMCY